MEELHPEVQFDARNNFDKIPTIIYQAFTNLKSNEWSIWITKYEQEDTVKGSFSMNIFIVLPIWFHTYHAEWIRLWFDQNSSWPFWRRVFTTADIEQWQNMSEDEIYRAIQASTVRPSMFGIQNQLQPRSSRELPYNPNLNV